MLSSVPNQYQITNVKVRYSTDEDKKRLIPMDHSMLDAMDTCETWGTIRMVKRLAMPGAKRALALEAGTVCHEGFSLIRWYQLQYYGQEVKPKQKDLDRWLRQQFTDDRIKQIVAARSDKSSHHTNIKNMLEVLVLTSGYYDDPYDKRRTISNIIDSLSLYADMYDFERYPIWIHKDGRMGLEQSFDIVLTLTIHDESYKHNTLDEPDSIHEIRFCGKMDGLHLDPKLDNEHIIQEDKTGSTVDDAWLAQWEMSHQITGYCFAASFIMGQPVPHARVNGLKIPPPSKERLNGLRSERVPRTQMHFHHWLRWMFERSVSVQRHLVNPLDAPRRTGSCNRYFHACAFMPLCTSPTREEQEETLAQMETVEYAPWEDRG